MRQDSTIFTDAAARRAADFSAGDRTRRRLTARGLRALADAIEQGKGGEMLLTAASNLLRTALGRPVVAREV